MPGKCPRVTSVTVLRPKTSGRSSRSCAELTLNRGTVTSSRSSGVRARTKRTVIPGPGAPAERAPASMAVCRPATTSIPAVRTSPGLAESSPSTRWTSIPPVPMTRSRVRRPAGVWATLARSRTRVVRRNTWISRPPHGPPSKTPTPSVNGRSHVVRTVSAMARTKRVSSVALRGIAGMSPPVCSSAHLSTRSRSATGSEVNSPCTPAGSMPIQSGRSGRFARNHSPSAALTAGELSMIDSTVRAA